MTEEVRPRIAFIGLGAMGAPMANNLLKAGFQVRGFDINSATSKRLEEAGGTFASSAADAAKDCQALVVIVLSKPQVDDVLFGAAGALDALEPGAVILGCSTTDPIHVAEVARRIEATGRHFIDAPVTGGAHGAEAATLTALSSGSNEAFALGEPVLQAMCKTIHRFGLKPGDGTTAKMANQLLCGVHLAVAAEAVELCRRTGIDTDKLFDVLEDGVAGSAMFNLRARQFMDHEFTLADLSAIFLKDLRAVQTLAESVSLETPLSNTALLQYQRSTKT